MDDLTRRGALALAGTVATLLAAAHVSADEPKPQDAPPSKDKPKSDTTDAFLAEDRKRVIACGMTEAEADCWEQTARAAGKFFELPKLHPMDDHEVAHAIHVIQHKLLSRPVYRKYLEMAKAQKK
jgi:hypothetical protein